MVFRQSKIKGVLDLGCGVGRHCIHLAKNRGNVVGNDVSKGALKMANELDKKEGLRNISLIQTTMTNLPIKDLYLDAALSINVIDHAIKRDIVKTIDEIRRVLKKNGLFLTDLISQKDPRYGKGLKVENDSFLIPETFEENRFEELHHFFTESEVSKLVTNSLKQR